MNLNEKIKKNDPEFVGIIQSFIERDVNESSKLSEKEKYISILAALIGCQGLDLYQELLKKIIDEKIIDSISIKEMIYQSTAYLGIARVCCFLEQTNKNMEESKIPLPLFLQRETDDETRFNEGLKKQISLFGVAMKTRQTGAPTLRRNINRWLVSNCFGDYYTRKGLDDYEREIVTFCFIFAQGGCENQLRGHVKANLDLGTNEGKLYGIVEQCLPYIGYPRSLNAMNIIDEVSSKLSTK